MSPATSRLQPKHKHMHGIDSAAEPYSGQVSGARPHGGSGVSARSHNDQDTDEIGNDPWGIDGQYASDGTASD